MSIYRQPICIARSLLCKVVFGFRVVILLILLLQTIVSISFGVKILKSFQVSKHFSTRIFRERHYWLVTCIQTWWFVILTVVRWLRICFLELTSQLLCRRSILLIQSFLILLHKRVKVWLLELFFQIRSIIKNCQTIFEPDRYVCLQNPMFIPKWFS